MHRFAMCQAHIPSIDAMDKRERLQYARRRAVARAINHGATIASRATPKWLVRQLGGSIGRRVL